MYESPRDREREFHSMIEKATLSGGGGGTRSWRGATPPHPPLRIAHKMYIELSLEKRGKKLKPKQMRACPARG